MMTAWYGDAFLVAGLCEGNPPLTGGFPHKGPVMRDFNVFFCCKAEQAIEETVELVVIRDAMTLMRRPCNDLSIIYPKYVLTIKIS